jgi:hypothetical protein
MADKTTVEKNRELLRKLKSENAWHIMKVGDTVYTDVVSCDYTDDSFAKIVIRWKDGIIYPKGDNAVIPVGLIQMYVPYEMIYGVFTGKIDDKLLDEVPQKIKDRYSKENFYEQTYSP